MRQSKRELREQIKRLEDVLYLKNENKSRTQRKLIIDETGVYLGGNPIEGCTRVDINKISPIHDMEAILHISVDEIDVKYGLPGADE